MGLTNFNIVLSCIFQLFVIPFLPLAVTSRVLFLKHCLVNEFITVFIIIIIIAIGIIIIIIINMFCCCAKRDYFVTILIYT